MTKEKNEKKKIIKDIIEDLNTFKTRWYQIEYEFVLGEKLEWYINKLIQKYKSK